MHRVNDIQTVTTEQITIFVNDEPVQACIGESVLGVLFALGMKAITKTNAGATIGAYCGMGICYCCTVKIDGVNKQRACQSIVYPDMRILTQTNELASQIKNNG